METHTEYTNKENARKQKMKFILQLNGLFSADCTRKAAYKDSIVSYDRRHFKVHKNKYIYLIFKTNKRPS